MRSDFSQYFQAETLPVSLTKYAWLQRQKSACTSHVIICLPDLNIHLEKKKEKNKQINKHNELIE